MFKNAVDLKKYCQECGNITHLHHSKERRVVYKMSFDQSIAMVTISILIIIFLELVKLSN